MICHARILRERIRVWTRRIRLVRKSEFSDRMHEDRLAGFDQPPSTERANKPWIGFLPALHYPSIYWWHYVMVSIIQPWTWDRGLLWLTLSFFIYITAKPVGYIYPKEISINTFKFYTKRLHIWTLPVHYCSCCMAARAQLELRNIESKCAIVWYKNWTYWSRSPLGICNRR